MAYPQVSAFCLIAIIWPVSGQLIGVERIKEGEAEKTELSSSVSLVQLRKSIDENDAKESLQLGPAIPKSDTQSQINRNESQNSAVNTGNVVESGESQGQTPGATGQRDRSADTTSAGSPSRGANTTGVVGRGPNTTGVAGNRAQSDANLQVFNLSDFLSRAWRILRRPDLILEFLLNIGALVPSGLGVIYLFASIRGGARPSTRLKAFKRGFLEANTPKEKFEWLAALVETFDRLTQEEQRVKKRSQAALGLGLLLLGVSISIVLSISLDPSSNAPTSFITAVTSLSPLILLQLTGVFLFRIFTQMEGQLRDIRNEISNVQYRMAAGVGLFATKSRFNDFATQLAREERNSNLRQHETTDASRSEIGIRDLGAAAQLINLVQRNTR